MGCCTVVGSSSSASDSDELACGSGTGALAFARWSSTEIEREREGACRLDWWEEGGDEAGTFVGFGTDFVSMRYVCDRD